MVEQNKGQRESNFAVRKDLGYKFETVNQFTSSQF